jgi:hypothetical protein
VSVKWSHGHDECFAYEGLSIVVPRHRDDGPDGPGVFRVVPMMDDGRESRTVGLHCTMLATQELFHVKDWRVRRFTSYKHFFSTINQMGKEHGRRCGTTIKATVPVPPVDGHAHVLFVIKYEKRGLLDWMDLFDAKTCKPIPGHKIRSQQQVRQYLEQQPYWKAACPNFKRYLPPLGQGDPWFGDWGFPPSEESVEGSDVATAAGTGVASPAHLSPRHSTHRAPVEPGPPPRRDVEASSAIAPVRPHAGVSLDDPPVDESNAQPPPSPVPVIARASPPGASEDLTDGAPAASLPPAPALVPQPSQAPEQQSAESSGAQQRAEGAATTLAEGPQPLGAAELVLKEEDVRSAAVEAARREQLLTTTHQKLSRALQAQETASPRLREALARQDRLELITLHADMARAHRGMEGKRAAAEAALHVLNAAKDVAVKMDIAYDAQTRARRSRELAIEAQTAHTSKCNALLRMQASDLVQRSLAEVRAKMAAGPENDPEAAQWAALEREAKAHLIASQRELQRAREEHGGEWGASQSVEASLLGEGDRRVRQRVA